MSDPWATRRFRAPDQLLRTYKAPIRVCIRIGHKWPDYTDHVLAYFVDCADAASDMVHVWDLTTGEQFEAPRTTASTLRGRWTKPANVRQRQAAADDLEMQLGERVALCRQLNAPRNKG